MAITILKILQNANHHLQNPNYDWKKNACRRQVKNAVILLEKGYPLDFNVHLLAEQYNNAEDVPKHKDFDNKSLNAD